MKQSATAIREATMHPFNQALLQRESELLSSLRDAAADEAASGGSPGEPSGGERAVWSGAQVRSRWQVIGTPRGELLVKMAAR
jgi:hypothetical protein